MDRIARTEHFGMRLTADEKAEMERKASAEKLPLVTWVRRKLLLDGKGDSTASRPTRREGRG